MRLFETFLPENSKEELVYRPSEAVVDRGNKRFSYTYESGDKYPLIEPKENNDGGDGFREQGLQISITQKARKQNRFMGLM